MGGGSEQSEKIHLRLKQQEAYDIITEIIENKTKFSVTEADPPGKIVAYGGRGPSKFRKIASGAVTLGMAAAVQHYTSPKRVAHIFLKEVNGVTIINIKSEGWTDRDSRVSTFVNTLFAELSEHTIDEMELRQNIQAAPTAEDPLTLLKKRFVNGEISKEEFEEMKKILD